MKKKTKFKPQKTAFSVTGYILMWILMMVVAVVFTQALRNSISYVFIIIAAAVLVLDLIYVLIARASVAADFSCSASQAQKNEPVYIALTVKNKSILPVPFTEAELILPDGDGLHSVSAAVSAPLTPRGSYKYDKSVLFPYKGEYLCGIKNLYVSSLLRFFRFRIKADKCKSVMVLPHRVTVADMPERYVNDSSAVSATPIKGTDSAEITEIKEYVPGDPIRNIHWKLSTKAQELITKHFGSENGLCTCIIAYTGRIYDVPADKKSDINEYCDDAVCELCCFAATESLIKGRRTSLVFPDAKRGTINRRTFEDTSSFEEYLPAFVCCGLSSPYPLRSLLEYVDEGEENDVIVVASRLDEQMMTELCGAQTVSCAVTLLLFEPSSRLENAGQVKEKNTAFIRDLLSANVNVRRIVENELEI